jgi:hypothetical protein
MHELASTLGRTEREILLETEDNRIAELGEDELIDLHRRIRRARNKYVGTYRRAGSKKVAKKGGRGKAKQANARNADRAEVFEDALARVSARLAAVASQEAEQLKAARLAAANPEGTWPGAKAPAKPARGKAGAAKVTDRKPSGPGRAKRDASSQAQGARRQAKKDSR